MLLAWSKCYRSLNTSVLQASRSNHLLGLTDDTIVFVLCREERKWRKWVDNTFVHTLSPNIYRTASEAMQAFEYFTKQSNFGTVEKYTTYLAGPVVMYFVGKHVKNKYVIFYIILVTVFLELCILIKTFYNKTVDCFSMQVRNSDSHDNELNTKKRIFGCRFNCRHFLILKDFNT